MDSQDFFSWKQHADKTKPAVMNFKGTGNKIREAVDHLTLPQPGYHGREINEKVTVEWLSLVENFDDFNRYPWGTQIWETEYRELNKIYTKIEDHESLPALRPTLRMSVSGYSYPFKIWIWETIPALEGIFSRRINENIPRFVRWQQIKKMSAEQVKKIYTQTMENNPPPNLRMRLTREETNSEYYASYVEYVMSYMP
ncbi:hypothetical protein L2E82_04850 [Cichorium intybus]|uniref:Uncharacterized protein n=1 Tax=Cichorium intybus TaxID=13427 RepID=A0ACB9H5Q1_CICIN|nr:hypothetical protein L2E82_04850 [Cichorium intybus]